MVIPAYGTRTIQVTKQVGVTKELLAKVLEDPKSYKEIFPGFVKDVKTSSDDKSRVKFVIDAGGTHDTDVKLSKQSSDTFLVEILSGDLRGSKIKTTLIERVGFDRTPGGATTVKCTLDLETGIMASIAMRMIGDSQIETEVGNGFYKLGEYAKSKYSQNSLVNVDYKKNVTPKLEAAKKLDPQKEAKKVPAQSVKKSDTTQTVSAKREAAKKLVTERNLQQKPIVNVKQEYAPQAKPRLDLSGTYLRLDSFPQTANVGNVVVFSGELHLDGTNPEGAIVYIKDEDPLGSDDFLAGGTVDSFGRFYISWTVKNMDSDSVADVYAVFEGTDIHPRMTTCGSSCSNTIPLTIR